MIEKPTPQQARAISLLGPNLIVSAAAGSGKTAVMVERAVDLIANGMDADGFLMVTFTNAAAAQMRARIAKELAARAAQTPDNAHLRRALERIDGAHISTINALCADLVRKYFHLLDVDPLFTIAGRGDQAVLRQQAMRALFDDRFAAGDDAFLYALEALTGFDEARLEDLVMGVFDFMRSSNDPHAWLERAQQAYAGGAYTRALLAHGVSAFPVRACAAASRCRAAAQAVLAHNERHHAMKKTPAMVTSLFAAADAFAFFSALPYGPCAAKRAAAIALPPASARNARMDETAFAPVRATLREAKALKTALMDEPLLNADIDDVMRHLRAMHEPVKALCALVVEFEQRYAALKAERTMLDFADVEHLALRLLADDETSAAIRRQYAHVFVDEYQDTNELQEAILTRIAAPGALFIVGDVKQSIYAFRHAEPSLFLRRYARSAPDGDGAPSQANVRLDLNTNFRSARNIIGFVNDVFARVMSVGHGGVAYDQSQALTAGSEDVGAPIAVRLLVSDSDEGDEGAAVRERIERTAVACAARVRELLDSGYRYQDIAILLRELKNTGPPFVTALTALGVPVSSHVSGDVLSARETDAMLSLLRAVNNARDDIAMLGALRSPAALLSARDLAKIRAHDKSLRFALAARAFAQTGEGDAAERVRAFFDDLDRYRALSARLRVDSLLSLIYDETNALAYYALRDDGEQKVQNLEALWFAASTFSRLGDGSLHGFLQMLRMHSELGVSEMATAPGGTDAVGLMSIHGAKGLEFPAVILPFLEKSLGRPGGGSVRLCREAGIAVRQYDRDSGSYAPSAMSGVVDAFVQKKERDEQLRLLYVALTRAKSSLTLVGDASAKTLQKACDAAPQEANSALALLLPTVASHPDGAALSDDAPPGRTQRAVGDAPAYGIALTLLTNPALYDAKISLGEAAPAPTPGAPHEDDAFVAPRLGYRYPHQQDTLIPAKISASALNARTAMPFEPLAPPEPIHPQTLSPAMVGTAVHQALLKLRFERVGSRADIDAQLDEQRERGLLNDAQRQAVDAGVLYNFFTSPVGVRLLSATHTLREQPFVARIPARAYDPALHSDAPVSLQGIIDCAFMEDGAWVLLDYKTNRMPMGGLEALRMSYQEQMDAYRHALEALTGAPVKECLLCLVTLGIQLEMAPGPLYEALAAPAAADA